MHVFYAIHPFRYLHTCLTPGALCSIFSRLPILPPTAEHITELPQLTEGYDHHRQLRVEFEYNK